MKFRRMLIAAATFALLIIGSGAAEAVVRLKPGW
jgi:hypothetical protein